MGAVTLAQKASKDPPKSFSTSRTISALVTPQPDLIRSLYLRTRSAPSQELACEDDASAGSAVRADLSTRTVPMTLREWFHL